MTNSARTGTDAGIGRLGTAVGWASAVCCLPYLVLKVAWTLDQPLGIADRSVLHDPGWEAGNALMGALQLAGLLLVLALTRPWARRLPAWSVLLPVWVGTGLLFQVAAATVLSVLASPVTRASGGKLDYGDFRPWVFTLVYSSFAVQGITLAVAFGCYVRARWSRLLRQPTSTVLETQATPARTRPANRLSANATVAAALALVAAIVCAYWAAGGSYGLSDSQRWPWQLQASRAVGALAAAVGLLGLTGRLWRRRPLWRPATLVWIGSGALVAFDGLGLTVNHLLLGADTVGWQLQDTLLTAKVLVGLFAAAVGALTLAAAARRDEQQAASGIPSQRAADRDAPMTSDASPLS